MKFIIEVFLFCIFIVSFCVTSAIFLDKIIKDSGNVPLGIVLIITQIGTLMYFVIRKNKGIK